MSQHLFDVDIAVKYGMEEAVFMKNMAYWINFNRAKDENFHDGRYWSYQKISAFVIIFPYWSGKQLTRIITSCITQGLMLKGHYNKKKYDQTLWYAITDLGLDLFKIPPGKVEIDPNSLNNTNCPNGQMELPKRETAVSQTVNPIPNKQPNAFTNIKSSCASPPQKPKTKAEWKVENEKKPWEDKKPPMADVQTQSTCFDPNRPTTASRASDILEDFWKNDPQGMKIFEQMKGAGNVLLQAGPEKNPEIEKKPQDPERFDGMRSNAPVSYRQRMRQARAQLSATG